MKENMNKVLTNLLNHNISRKEALNKLVDISKEFDGSKEIKPTITMDCYDFENNYVITVSASYKIDAQRILLNTGKKNLIKQIDWDKIKFSIT